MYVPYKDILVMEKYMECNLNAFVTEIFQILFQILKNSYGKSAGETWTDTTLSFIALLLA